MSPPKISPRGSAVQPPAAVWRVMSLSDRRPSYFILPFLSNRGSVYFALWQLQQDIWNAGAVMEAQTDGTIGAGTYFVEGSSLATAFSNPRNLVLIQVVNNGGK